jgi:hypothetical protein
MIMH